MYKWKLKIFSKNFLGSILIFFTIISLLNTISGACSVTPSKVEIYSGNYFVGSFDYNYLKMGNFVYIKKDLDTSPLKIKFIFSVDNSCFDNVSQMNMKLFSNGLKIPASAFDYSNGNATFVFVFNQQVSIMTNFISYYDVKDLKGGTLSDSINFAVDNDKPTFAQIDINGGVDLIKSGTSIPISFNITDQKSGLDSVSIGGIVSKNYNSLKGKHNFNFSGSYPLSATTNVIITAKDKLGNTLDYTKKIYVDDYGPVFNNLKILKYFNNGGSHAISFSVEVTDLSYNFSGQTPDITGNFSALNPTLTKMNPSSCAKIDDETYECKFKNIVINNIQKSQIVEITFQGVDKIGNKGNQTFSKKILFDSQGPKILDFYLINSFGEKNIFNAYDSNIQIVLKLTDDSLISKSDIKIIPSFDGMEKLLIPDCVINNKVEICKWNLSNLVQKYSAIQKINLTFYATLQDIYNNPTKVSLNVSVNNQKPIIKKIWYEEESNVKDGIISSGEIVDFKMFVVADSNDVKFDKDHIFANFSSIDFEDGSDHYAGSCSYYNKTTIECDFNGVKVENGYLKQNVTFYFIGLSGTTAVQNYPVEVFAVSNKVFSSFKISDLTIINPLDRFKVSKVGAVGWFKGVIKKASSQKNKVYLVNYYLLSCNDSDMNPILVGSRELYPENVVSAPSPNKEPDKNFIIKTEVDAHPNEKDLITKNMTCTMSILKRDNTTVYNPELVKFKIIFEFRSLPLGSSLKAEAGKIKSLIKDAKLYGKWFDSTYKIYNVFNNICSVISGANGLMAGIDAIGTNLNLLFSETWFKEIFSNLNKMTSMGDTSIGSIFTDHNSPVKLICDFVTCRNGGILGSNIKQKFPEVNNFINKYSHFENFCS